MGLILFYWGFVEVLPLVYNALESEHSQVQERALQCVPDLCETIDFSEVQSVLFTRVAVRPSPFNLHQYIYSFLFFLFLDCVYEDEDIEREGLRVAEFFEPCEDFGSGR